MANRVDTDRLQQALGDALREAREKLGYSQEELGVERGARNPTLKTMVRLCNALELRPSNLLRRAEDRASFEP